VPLRIDAHPKAVGCLNISGRLPSKSDRPLLLGEAIGQLWGCCDLRVEFCSTLRGKRSVCERSQLDDLLIAGLVSATTSYGHGTTNGSSRPADRSRHIAVPFRCGQPRVTEDTRERPSIPRRGRGIDLPFRCPSGLTAPIQ
jgi:hypothetical protein